MENYTYYIKTEEELINEFGEEWINDLPLSDFSNIGIMNYLLGTKIETYCIKEQLINGRLDLNDRKLRIKIPCDTSFIDRGYWLIRKDVIKEIPNIPDYNTSKQLIYEKLQLNDYDAIIYKCDDEYDLRNTLKFALNNGFVYFITADNFNNCKFILFDVKNKDMLSDNNVINYPIEYGSFENGVREVYGETAIYIDKFIELEKLFGIKKNSIDMYNSPRQLVYESNINTKYKYRFKTEQEFLDEFGYDWRTFGGTHWTNSDDMDYLFGKVIEPKYYDEFLDNGRLDMGTYDRFVFDNAWNINIKMIKEIPILPDYKTPRKLVYESNKFDKSDEYDCILCKCLNDKEVIYIQEFAFSKGYLWNGSSQPIVNYLDLNHCSIISLEKSEYRNGKKILMRVGAIENDGWTMDYYYQNQISEGYENVICLNGGFEQLKRLFGVEPKSIDMYNKPRKLVYESKILKFNNYK